MNTDKVKITQRYAQNNADIRRQQLGSYQAVQDELQLLERMKMIREVVDKRLPVEERMFTLSSADFDDNGTARLYQPIEMSHVKIGEIFFKNMLPNIHLGTGRTLVWAEAIAGGGAGQDLQVTLDEKIWSTTDLAKTLGERMTQMSKEYHNYSLQDDNYRTYTVNFDVTSGTTVITVKDKDASQTRNIFLRDTEFSRRVLGFRDGQFNQSNSTHVSFDTFNFTYGGAVVVTSDLVPFTSGAHGRNMEPTLCIVPLTSPNFYTILHRPVTPYLSIGEKRVVNHITIKFKDVSLVEQYSPNKLKDMYIVFNYY